MNTVRIALVLAAALVACGREKMTATDSVGYVDHADGSLQSKVASPPPAPPVAAAAAFTGGEAREESMATAQRGRLAANQIAAVDATAADALQGVNYSTTAAASTMIIRTGQAFIEVDKVDPAMLKIRQLVAQVGGYVTNSSISGGKDQVRQASIEIKIPNTRYDEAVGSLSSIGKVETVNSNAQDVGEEFVDVSARVANARRLEERLIDLLAKRTGKLDEVLRVERELARVREEIERYEGRLRYLTARVALSTLTVNIHEPAPIIEPGRSPIAEAFRRAWQNFVAMVASLIASLGVLVPIGLIGIGGWIGYRRRLRTHRPLTT
ncbi:MAG TPA: DUF4349 domain-containing protein [Gemmatimonadaceae bacterium]|nr:DUF4349 domain-containing protein [Gemmatimonadaceae bacterium]